MDWVPKYMTDEGFDLPRLLNDDFMVAIKLLFNNGFYISATKLIMCFIDTMAYIEYGDGGHANFRNWLDAYVDLTKVNVSSEEIWEHRNSLVHLSTLSSRKVAAGKVRRLVAYVGNLPKDSPSEDAEAKWFSLWYLLEALAVGIGEYAQALDSDRSKISHFAERYDHILSDKRMMYFKFDEDSCKLS